MDCFCYEEVVLSIGCMHLSNCGCISLKSMFQLAWNILQVHIRDSRIVSLLGVHAHSETQIALNSTAKISFSCAAGRYDFWWFSSVSINTHPFQLIKSCFASFSITNHVFSSYCEISCSIAIWKCLLSVYNTPCNQCSCFSQFIPLMFCTSKIHRWDYDR